MNPASNRARAFWRAFNSLSAIILIWIAGAFSAFSQTRQIVLVYDERIDLPGLALLNAGFTRVLTSGSPDNVELYREEMDLSRFDSQGYRDLLRNEFRARYAAKKIDVVVAIMPPAVDFLLTHRDEIFPGTPIVFCGLDRKQLGEGTLPADVTGVLVKREFSPTLDLAARLHPETERIVVVAGTSEFDTRLLTQAREEFKLFEKRFAFTYLTNFPLPELLSRLSQLPPKTLVLYTTMFRDGAGQPYVPHDVAERVSAAANAPVYGFVDQYVGHGIVGGRVYGFGLHGEEAAGLVLKILSGRKPQELPPIEPASTVTMFDARQLQRWKINEHRLPAGSTVLFREPTVWDRYRTWIIGGVSVVALQAALIFGLLANLFRRRRAEGSLVESEQRFQNAADAAPVLMWMAGPDKRAIFFNKAWLNFTGRTMEQELDDGWADVVHEEDLENTAQRYQTAFDAHEPFVIQNRLRRHDGEFRWVTASGVPRYDGKGNFLGYVGASIDITDLLKKEEALHESEERITLAAEAAHLGVWELNLATNELWVSDQWRSLFQIKPGVPVTLDEVSGLIHMDDGDRRTIALQKAIAENSGYEIEYRALLPDKTVRWIAGRVRCLPNEHGLPRRLLGVSADVTDRKQAEELFRLATEASPSGTVLMNARGRIVLVNAHSEELFGYERHELIDQPVEILIPDRFRAAFPAHRAAFLAAPQSRALGTGQELFARRKDGSEFPVEIGLNPIATSEGDFVLASVIDITQRLHAQIETQLLQDEIAHVGRVSMMGQLASALAHEINQPLGAILRNAEAAELFLQSKTPDLEEIRAILADIRTDDQRAGSVIDRMRALLKRHALETELLDLTELVGNVTELARPDAVTRQVKLAVNLPAELPAVRGDRVHLQQVLLNLILNGMDALKEANQENRRVAVSVRTDHARTVEIAVSDTGHGIAADKLAQIFDPFFTTKPEGMGMGLAISRTIIEAHGGRLWAENNDGPGATFRFTLPVAEETGREEVIGNQ